MIVHNHGLVPLSECIVITRNLETLLTPTAYNLGRMSSIQWLMQLQALLLAHCIVVSLLQRQTSRCR